jgi:hypothetical protein
MPKRFKLISCEIFTREVCAAVQASPNTIDIEFLPKGLHDIGADGMQGRLAEVLAGVDESRYDAVLLGYGLCNNGLANLRARTIPLVLPRAHDCIALFLGSKERYKEYFNANPGTYFLTSGWIERGAVTGELVQLTIGRRLGIDQSFDELVEKYGEENAEYLAEQLGIGADGNYSKYAYIEMGVEPPGMEAEGRRLAAGKGWEFEKVPGDMTLLRELLDGDWPDEHFLVIPPGGKVKPSYDEGVVKAE